MSYEDFKIHMSQMYQQYERQRVDNITDPAVRQQHPISTISGLDDDAQHIAQSQQRSTVRITEYTEPVSGRDAIFPDFSGIPDFLKSKLLMENQKFQSKIGKMESVIVSMMRMLSQLLFDSLPCGAT